jgi:hypothetical protein
MCWGGPSTCGGMVTSITPSRCWVCPPSSRMRTRIGPAERISPAPALTIAMLTTLLLFLHGCRHFTDSSPNQIYRRLESCLTEAAQFTELLLTPPTVLEAVSPELLRPTTADVHFKQVNYAHAGAPRFTAPHRRHTSPSSPKSCRRVRHHGRGTRDQAVRRPAPAGCARPRHPARRADPAARRGH